MKKTGWIDAFRGIQKRFVSFLSIVLIVALGSGGFFVTQYLQNGYLKKADDYYNRYNLKDFQMTSSLGVTDDDIRRIERVSGVKEAEGVILLEGKCFFKDSSSNITILSLTSKVSVPELVEGRLPQTDSECMVAADFAAVNNIHLNEPLELEALFNGEEALKNKRYTIVGFHNHPDYVRSNTTYTVLVKKDAFDSKAMNDLYTRVFITAEKDREYLPFEEKYYEDLAYVKNNLNSLGRDLEDSSIRHMQEIGNKKIDEEWIRIKGELDAAQQEINEGQSTLTRELNSASYQISAGRNRLNDSYNQLVEGQIELEEGENELVANMSSYYAIRNLLDTTGLSGRLKEIRAEAASEAKDAYTIYNNIKDINYQDIKEDVVIRNRIISVLEWVINNIDRIKNSYAFRFAELIINDILHIADLDKILEDAKYYLNNLETLTDDALEGMLESFKTFFKKYGDLMTRVVNKIDEIFKGESAIANGKEELNDAKRQLAYGWNEYENGKSQLASAQSQYYAKKAEAEEKILDAQTLLNEKKAEAEEGIKAARAKLNDITCSWIVTDRRAESGYMELYGNVSAFKSAGLVFGLLFSLVGGLVCFSTLVIIIEEERKYVGTAKAFGFRNNEILGKYLLFGVLSVLLGLISGVILAYFGGDIIQGAIARSGMFNFGKADSVINVKTTLIVSVILILMAALVSVFSCAGLLRSPASTLMKGQIVSNSDNRNKAKESSRKGSLYSRLIWRNIITDKARVIISIIIVAGSVLIIGAGISIRDSFRNMQQTQLRDVFTYDVRIDYNSNISEEEFSKLEKVLKKNNVFYLNGGYYNCLYKNDDVLDGLNLIVADKNEINNFIQLKDPDTHKKITLPESGFLAQNKLMEKKKLKEGDIWVVYDNKLNKHYISYAGTFNNYVGRIIMMSFEAYEEAFGFKPELNCIYVNLDGADYDKLTDELLKVNEELSFNRPNSLLVRFSSVNALYDIIVYVMIGISILMSFMILTNLANIFINRKKKELIVMRINGFSIKKTKNYLIKETVITTIVGLSLGTGLGAMILSKMAIKAMEGNDIQFVRTLNPKAWVIAVVLESLFALIIYHIAFKKVEKLNFKEIA